MIDADPVNPPQLFQTGDETTVGTIIPEFIIPAGAISGGAFGNGTDVSIDLGNMLNVDNDPNQEFIVIEFNALTTNVLTNQAGATLSNDAIVLIDGAQVGMAASPVIIQVAEPSITNLTKTTVQLDDVTLDPTAHDAGDRVRFRTRFSNATGPDVSIAYDVQVLDTPPAQFMTLDNGSIRVFRNGTQIFTGFANNSTATTVDITLDIVNPGDEIIILYDVILTTDVQPEQMIQNDVDLTYTSLPGTNGTIVNPTGSANTGTPGSAIGERNGSDGMGGLNDYVDTASNQITTLAPRLAKTIVRTDITETTANQFDTNLSDLAIGEIVTYLVGVNLPEGTNPIVLTDQLPTGNAGVMQLLNAEIVFLGNNLTGSQLAVGDTGVTSDSDNDGLDDAVSFDFGNVINTPDNTVNLQDLVLVRVVAQVMNDPQNNASDVLRNTATLTYPQGQQTAFEDIEVVEPDLEVIKEVVGDDSLDVGSTVTYRATIRHTNQSSAIAFNLNVTDTLPGTLQLNSAQIISAPTYNSPDFDPPVLDVTGNTVTLMFDFLDHPNGPTYPNVTDEIMIEYQATILAPPDPNAPAFGATIPNTANLTYDSYFLPSGSNIDVSRPYTDSDNAQITVNSVTISGNIYVDLDNDGAYEPGDGETLIDNQPVMIQLTGTDINGNPVNRTITTNNGTYTFTGVLPSDATGYTITQLNQPLLVLAPPIPFVDGSDTPGTIFGGIGTVGGDPRDAEAITNIVVPPDSNGDAVNYDFGELIPALIGDFVWDDLNANGIQETGEPGIQGITVMLTGTSQTGVSINRTVTTGPNGGYGFTQLPPGTYTITFGNTDGTLTYLYTTQNVPNDDTIDSDGNATTGITAPITLMEGEINRTVDQGLFRNASIGDFVWYDINGDGVQDANEPGIPGVTVILDGAGADGMLDTPDDQLNLATDITNGMGNYLFTDLRPGTFRVRIDSSTIPNGLSNPTFDFDGLASPNQADVTVISGEVNRDLDFGYNGLGALGDTVWYDVNQNGIQDNNEPGIANVDVIIRWSGFDGVLDTPDDVLITETTDPNGNYNATTLPLGLYRVNPNPATLPPDLVATFDLDSGTTNPDGTTEVTLTAGIPDRDDVDFGYTGQASIGDFIWLDFNGDGIQDPNEPGLMGVTVTATWFGPDGNPGGGDDVVLTDTTDANGLYSFTALPGGEYQVVVTSGLPNGVVNTGDPDGTLDGQTTFRLGTTDNRTDIDFGYQGTNSLAGFVYRDFSVDGIRQPAGLNPETGIPGVTIALTGTDNVGNAITQTTVTGPDGSYSFVGLPTGDYLITETQPPSPLVAGQSGFYDGLDAVGTINGVSTGSSPMKNQLQVSLGTGENGIEYNFGENPPADPFGFVYIDLNQNGTRDVNEPGIPNVTIVVSGTAFAGTPLARPLTAAEVPGGLVIQTDANGRWEYPIIPPGTYSFVETQPPGFDDGLEENADPNPPMTVIVGNDRFDNVELDPFPIRGPFNFGEFAVRGSLSGSVYLDANQNGVRDSGELGIPGVTVQLTGTDLAGANVNATVVTDADGNYSFLKLRPGNYQLIETQPRFYTDGTDRAGSAGGIASNDVISSIPLGPNEAAVNYDFGEGWLHPQFVSKRFFLSFTENIGILPMTPGSGSTIVNNVGDPSGFVYIDLNRNGQRDTGEIGISDVLIRLDGITDEGAVVSLYQLTNEHGFYQFGDLQPGIYSLSEEQPQGFEDGQESVGTLGGVAGNNAFFNIRVNVGDNGTDYNFGEYLSDNREIDARVWENWS